MRLLSLLVLAAVGLAGQAAKEANSRYETPEGRRAVGAGLGRSSRDAEQRPRELVDAMRLKPGMTVADIGTGVGYMLPWLSHAVGSEGRVLAEDIFDDLLNSARERTENEKLANVSFVKGTEHDPNLPANSVDDALALDSYHHY